MKNPQDEQHVLAKHGEVEFRRKLASQESEGGQIAFPELHTHDEMLQVMRQRAAATRDAMALLSREGIRLSPYIELGAERCQRAMVLENEFDAQGIAVDISFDMLQLGAEVAKAMGYEKMPIRICCDAYNLPIRDSALPFAFCYATLHHFPDPAPILTEMERVLGDHGVLYFDEEPVRGAVYRFTRLYHRHGHRLNILEKVLERLGVLSLFSEAGGIEREHGILEEEFDLMTWQRSLAPFQTSSVTINKRLGLRLRDSRFSLSRALAWSLGGNIEAVCRVSKTQPVQPTSAGLLEILKCPNCADRHSAPLKSGQDRQGLQCQECGHFYPEVDGVIFLFEHSLGHKLYPAYFPEAS